MKNPFSSPVDNRFISSPDFNLNKIRKITLGIIMGVLGIVYLGFEYFQDGDFFIYYHASRELFQLKNIYREFYGACECFPYFGSPTLALILGPFANLPFFFAAFLWKGLNLFFLYRSWILLEKYFDLNGFTKNEYITFVTSSIFSVSFVIYRNFHLGQFTIFLLYVILEGIYQIRSGKAAFGSAIIALGIISKVMPIVALPYLIYRNHWKSALMVIAFTMIFLFLPMVYLGWEQTLFLIKEWKTSIDPVNEMNIFDVSTNDIHGLASLISTLFIPGIEDLHTLHLRRHIFVLNKETVELIIHAGRLLLIVGTIYFLRTWPFKKEDNPLKQIWELGYILLITSLVFPQQRLYAFYFLFPALTYLVYNFIVIRKSKDFTLSISKWWFYIFILGVLIFNLELILGNFRQFYWHYKTVTYSVLILLVVLSRLRPYIVGNYTLTNKIE
ncbi:MAG: DUF2029 domain-containing protein [Opitutaceae bacterium]|nr:DUF2029 domain-containing protein [Cytophagales bacterium]